MSPIENILLPPIVAVQVWLLLRNAFPPRTVPQVMRLGMISTAISFLLLFLAVFAAKNLSTLP